MALSFCYPLAAAVQDFGVRYVAQGLPNHGFLEVHLPIMAAQMQSTWTKVCASSSDSAKTALTKSACGKFGYSTGITFLSTSGPCALVDCPSADASMGQCQAKIEASTQPVLSVSCYYQSDLSLAQQPPLSDRKFSVSCDFDNGTTCGWDMAYVQSVPAKNAYSSDATRGTSEGGIVISQCPQEGSSANLATLTSPYVDRCLNTHYCFVFFGLRLLFSDPSEPAKLKVSVINNDNLETFTTSVNLSEASEWTRNEIDLTPTGPFRIRIILDDCTKKRASQLALDGFMLTTGQCPSKQRTYCYNNGYVEDPDGDDSYCRCKGQTRGRWCELATCGAGMFRFSVGIVLLVSAISVLCAVYT